MIRTFSEPGPPCLLGIPCQSRQYQSILFPLKIQPSFRLFIARRTMLWSLYRAGSHATVSRKIDS